ncbi:MAG: DUF4345 family protein [Candidatus Hodarchaeota archaeon]
MPLQQPLLGLIGIVVVIYGGVLLIYPHPRLVVLNAAIKIMEAQAEEREVRKKIRFYGVGVIVVGIFLFWLSIYGLDTLLALFS